MSHCKRFTGIASVKRCHTARRCWTPLLKRVAKRLRRHGHLSWVVEGRSTTMAKILSLKNPTYSFPTHLTLWSLPGTLWSSIRYGRLGLRATMPQSWKRLGLRPITPQHPWWNALLVRIPWKRIWLWHRHLWWNLNQSLVRGFFVAVFSQVHSIYFWGFWTMSTKAQFGVLPNKNFIGDTCSKATPCITKTRLGLPFLKEWSQRF